MERIELGRNGSALERINSDAQRLERHSELRVGRVGDTRLQPHLNGTDGSPKIGCDKTEILLPRCRTRSPFDNPQPFIEPGSDDAVLSRPPLLGRRRHR